ncbi:MAG: hypothetical protein D6683_12485 [Actinomyces sp.]|nr:MAG: hypothetical protein D6683_12485 [Actinomyces sp.]
MAGLAERRDLLDAYAAAGGRPIDESTLRWWELFGVLRWGIICQMQADAHLSGRVRSLEHALIGRRVAETEVEILRHLGVDVAGVAAATTGESGGGPGVHRDPDAAALAEALAGELDALVGDATGRTAFRLRVAARAARVLARQASRSGQAAGVAAGLVAAGHPDETALAEAVRRGRVDLGTAVEVAAPLAVERLRVVDPDDLAS